MAVKGIGHVIIRCISYAYRCQNGPFIINFLKWAILALERLSRGLESLENDKMVHFICEQWNWSVLGFSSYSRRSDSFQGQNSPFRNGKINGSFWRRNANPNTWPIFVIATLAIPWSSERRFWVAFDCILFFYFTLRDSQIFLTRVLSWSPW